MSINNIDDGGPAYPDPMRTMIEMQCEPSPGMSLRDHFAAKALEGSLAYSASDCSGIGTELERENVANWCYQMADAMIESRKVKP